MREEQTAKEREALDAAKVHKNEGIGTRSWSDVATEMVSVLDNSLAASESGDGERGAELVNEAYYQYYEKLGFKERDERHRRQPRLQGGKHVQGKP